MTMIILSIMLLGEVGIAAVAATLIFLWFGRRP